MKDFTCPCCGLYYRMESSLVGCLDLHEGQIAEARQEISARQARYQSDRKQS